MDEEHEKFRYSTLKIKIWMRKFKYLDKSTTFSHHAFISTTIFPLALLLFDNVYASVTPSSEKVKA